MRPGKVQEVRDIARSAGNLILASNGVIRSLQNWGPFLLPRKTRVHQMTHSSGQYFIMRFDSSAQAQQMVKRTLGLDPRMVKFTVLKLGRTLEEVGKVGKAGDGWN